MGRIEVIGDCTLYLADCRDVLPTLEPVDLVVGDPPYSISLAGISHEKAGSGGTREFDFFEGDDDWQAMTAKVAEAFSLVKLKDHASMYVWCGHRQFGRLVQDFETRGFSTRMLAWAKLCPCPAPPGAGWPSGFELCVYAYRKGRTWTHRNSPKNNVFWVDSFRHGQPGKEAHPTQKPEATIRPLIEASSLPGQTVLDPFMGSGTTGVVCAKAGRKFIGCEIKEEYFDLACDRIRRAYAEPEMFTAPEESA